MLEDFKVNVEAVSNFSHQLVSGAALAKRFRGQTLLNILQLCGAGILTLPK